MGALTRRQDQIQRRMIRDTGCPRALDVLPPEKLQSLLALWKHRLATGEYPADTCQRMISMYDLRIYRQGVNGVATADSKIG